MRACTSAGTVVKVAWRRLKENLAAALLDSSWLASDGRRWQASDGPYVWVGHVFNRSGHDGVRHSPWAVALAFWLANVEAAQCGAVA